MRVVIWLLLLAIVAVVAASLLGRNDNLVTLYWAPWRVDLSFNLFMVALVGFCLVLMALIRGITGLVGLPRRARVWRVARRDRLAQAALREALAQYFGGRYSRAHKAAQRAVTIQGDTPDLAQDKEFTALGHLLAAGSLHRLQDRTRRDEALRQAFDATAGSGTAARTDEGARLLAAEWALDDRDARRTLELLSELPPGVARRTQALRLKLQAARLADEPMEALRTARLLAKHQGFSPAAATGLLRSLAIETLGTARDVDQLKRVWRELDAGDRRDVHVAIQAARQLAQGGATEDARQWLRPFWEDAASLERDEREALALALADLSEGIGPEWLPRLEAALQSCPGEPALAYAMGRSLLARQIWGKARQLLQTAAADAGLAAPARRDAWLRLAAMAEHEGDAVRTAECFREAAAV